MKVSIIIPTFRESDKLENLLNNLINDKYQEKEIISVIDEPTKKSLIISRKYKKNVEFILNKKRLGKVKAANIAAKRSTGDILFFIDSDNTIDNSKGSLLQKILEQIDGYDYATLKIKVNKNSLISKMAHYDYVSAAFVNYIFSKFLKRTPVMSGQAFVMKKEVFNELGGFEQEVSEDLDLSTKAFLKKMKFAYLKDLEVLNDNPESWKTWVKQRERWGIGTCLWIKKYFKPMMKNTVNYPHLFLSSFFTIFPTILLFLINFILSKSILEKIIYSTLLLVPFKLIGALPVVFFIFSTITFVKSMILYLLAFVISCSMSFLTARTMKYDFSLTEYMFYYFIYSPIALSVYVASALKGLFISSDLKDWKV